MENNFIQQGSWQGWNDFLGITKEDNIESYLVNLIGDIKDGFKSMERKDELANILVHDANNSFLIHSVNAYKGVKPDNPSWHQVRIYQVDEYFAVISTNWKSTYRCDYLGQDANIAAKEFFRIVEILQKLLANMLTFEIIPKLNKMDEKEKNSCISGYYKYYGYEVPQFTDKDTQNLIRVLKMHQKHKSKKD